jgi:hypothetical protein
MTKKENLTFVMRKSRRRKKETVCRRKEVKIKNIDLKKCEVKARKECA